MITFIHVPVTLDAAAGEDSPRTITGIAVPWDTTATVSDGTKVQFVRGAFDTAQKAPKLIENHDLTQLRGTVACTPTSRRPTPSTRATSARS